MRGAASLPCAPPTIIERRRPRLRISNAEVACWDEEDLDLPPVRILRLHQYKSNPADLKLTQFQIGFAVPENCCRTLTF